MLKENCALHNRVPLAAGETITLAAARQSFNLDCGSELLRVTPITLEFWALRLNRKSPI